MIKKFRSLKLSVIGLGYVGLPLALEFGKRINVVGFDPDKKRIKQLNFGLDKNLEISSKEIKKAKYLKFTSNKKYIINSNCFVVTVPTPIDKNKKPNLKPLLDASKTISKVLEKGCVVIYESTVYPGCIEEKCVPVLEKYSRSEEHTSELQSR